MKARHFLTNPGKQTGASRRLSANVEKLMRRQEGQWNTIGMLSFTFLSLVLATPSFSFDVIVLQCNVLMCISCKPESFDREDSSWIADSEMDHDTGQVDLMNDHHASRSDLTIARNRLENHVSLRKSKSIVSHAGRLGLCLTVV
jgi:hypothetical protein